MAARGCIALRITLSMLSNEYVDREQVCGLGMPKYVPSPPNVLLSMQKSWPPSNIMLPGPHESIF